MPAKEVGPLGMHKAPLPCLGTRLYCSVAVSKNACDHYFALMLPEDGLPEGKAIAHVGRSQLIDMDMDINDVVPDSRGRKPDNSRCLRGLLKRLRRHPRAPSRKIDAAKSVCEGEQAFRLRDFFGANTDKARLRLA